MRYLTLLYDDEANGSEPGTPEFDAEMAGYMAFGELAGAAIVGGEALLGSDTTRTVRHLGGTVRVTDGPFAETAEVLGGYYILEAPSLDDAIELARNIPAVDTGAIEIRPMVQWVDRADEVGPAAPDATRWLATIHGPETAADQPDTDGWAAGAEAHGTFMKEAANAVLGAGAVHPVGTATTIRVRDGELLVTDGPFSEALEVVGGFYLLRGTTQEVADLAQLIPVNDAGGIEIRPIMELDG